MGLAKKPLPSTSQFMRVVNLESDVEQHSMLRGYVLTGTGRKVLR